MSHRTTKIRNLKTIKALRGDILTIDLGQTFDGTLTAWMKKTKNSINYRNFDIIDNRYIQMSRINTRDFYSGTTLTEAVEGKWFFDVEFLKTGDVEENTKTVYTGTILFVNDITGSRATEAIYLDEFGGNSLVMMKAIYDPDLIEADVFDIDNLKESNLFKKMTAAERVKLAGIKESKYVGLFTSEVNLPTTGSPGDYADVDLGVGNDVVRYIWDVDDSHWVLQLGESTALTDIQIKTQYENNIDTNAYTDAEKIKLGGIDSANIVYRNIANVFTAIQSFLSTGIDFVNTSGYYTRLFETSGTFNISLRDPLNVVINQFTFRSNRVSANHGTVDLGSTAGRFRELFLTSFANVLGIKSVENDSTKVFASDGSIISNRPIDRENNIGNVVGATLTLDLTSYETFTAVLTEATTIAISNPIIKAVTLDVTGNFALSYPTGAVVVGDTYDGTVGAKVVIEYKPSITFITVTNYA